MIRWCTWVMLLANAVAAAQQVPIPAPPQIGATSAILMDGATGEVLAFLNPDERVEPASITKLMTSYVVFKALEDGLVTLDEEAYVSEKAWRTEGSRMFVDVDTRVPVKDLIMGMIVQSGNDASVALAEHVAGSEEAFVDLMNRYASELGMTNTSYMNSTGLPGEYHYSSARDAALIAQAIINEFPDYYAWYSEREFTWNDIRQPNRNNLLWRDDSVDGLKTGHTEAAGYCLVSSAERNGMRLIAAVMGTSSMEARLDASQALLNYGFRFYSTDQLFSAGEPVTELGVWKAEVDTVEVGLAENIVMTIPRNGADAVTTETVIESDLVAPVEAGQVVGELQVSFDGELRHTAPLVTLAEVPAGSFWTRLVDEVALWFE